MRQSVLFSVLFLCLASCSSKKEPPPPPSISVTDFIIKPQTIPVVFDFIGFAESSHAVEIRARVEGYLDKIAYEEGQLVKEGALLFQLDPSQYQAKVEQARAETSKQKAILENAKLTVKRLQPLYEQKAASKKDLDNAIAAQLSAEASLQAAEAQLLEANINLGYTHIVSPVTGLADKSKYREGSLISPGANNLLTTVSVLDPIWVYFTVSDNDILRTTKQRLDHAIILPKPEEFIVEAIQGDDTVFPYKGKLNFNAPSYDQSTGALLMRAVFPNPQEGLRPGEFVRVKVYGAKRPNAIAIPQRALMQKKNGMFVYLIGSNNQAIAQDVSVGEWYGDYQIISNGLKPGDRIVVDGTNKIRPGTSLHIAGPWKPQEKKEETSS